jgi:hypothetical protein
MQWEARAGSLTFGNQKGPEAQFRHLIDVEVSERLRRSRKLFEFAGLVSGLFLIPGVCAGRFRATLPEHDAEKCEAVFGQHHALNC